MAPKKKQSKNKKIVNKKVPIKRKASNKNQKSFNSFSLVFTKVISTILAKPFFLINLAINRALLILKNIFLSLKKVTLMEVNTILPIQGFQKQFLHIPPI